MINQVVLGHLTYNLEKKKKQLWKINLDNDFTFIKITPKWTSKHYNVKGNQHKKSFSNIFHLWGTEAFLNMLQNSKTMKEKINFKT